MNIGLIIVISGCLGSIVVTLWHIRRYLRDTLLTLKIIDARIVDLTTVESGLHKKCIRIQTW